MELHDLMRQLRRDNGSKIVLVVADGLGGMSRELHGGPTELEAAATPHLDDLASKGVCGLAQPILPGITTGSGPGHLALFGYDPLRFQIGRGVLSALGIAFDLQPGDVAARGNFCTIDEEGRVTDRRAGRIATEEAARLVEKLRACRLEDAELFLEPVRDYRMVMVLRGEDLGAEVDDTDPQATGVPPREPRARSPESEPTAELVKAFLHQAREILRDEHPANMVNLRGFSQRPRWPSFSDVYGLRACAIATYPMYRGLARLLGMDVGVDEDADLTGQVDALQATWERYDFFFLHYKYPDSRGEDGDFEAKVRAIEALDAQIARIQSLIPDVLIVTGDHSTPSRLRTHSWHPVPVVLSARTCRVDAADRFGETACARDGGLGLFEAKHLMSLAMAHANRLEKFGA